MSERDGSTCAGCARAGHTACVWPSIEREYDAQVQQTDAGLYAAHLATGRCHAAGAEQHDQLVAQVAVVSDCDPFDVAWVAAMTRLTPQRVRAALARLVRLEVLAWTDAGYRYAPDIEREAALRSAANTAARDAQ